MLNHLEVDPRESPSDESASINIFGHHPILLVAEKQVTLMSFEEPFCWPDSSEDAQRSNLLGTLAGSYVHRPQISPSILSKVKPDYSYPG